MKRLPNWERLLADHFAAAGSKPFAWGVNDCGMSVGDAILAITGIDPIPGLRGEYSDETGALGLVGEDLGAFAADIAKAIGADEVRPTYARRGDVVLVDNRNPKHALGVVDHTGRFALCVGDGGLIRVRMHRWLRAWKIG